MFTKLYDSMIEMADDQKNQYNNLFRWYRHIQNLPEVTAFLTNRQRILVEDPEVKVPFLAEKKKSKKWIKIDETLNYIFIIFRFLWWINDWLSLIRKR